MWRCGARIAFAQTFSHGAEKAGVIPVAPFAGLIANLDGIDQPARAGGTELAGEGPTISARIPIEVAPVRAADGLEHEAGIDVPALFPP